MNKKFLSVIFFGAVLAMSLGSCKNEIDDVFDQDAAARMNTALSTYKDVLTAPSNGWVMEYFATDAEQGYTFLMKFDKNGSVNIAAKNTYTSNKMAQETSLYQFIGDDGPVLTFNSYNNLFHRFSTPEAIDGMSNGVGHGGDYEFIVMNASADSVKLQGKKAGYTQYMYPVTSGTSWEDYFNQLDTIDVKMFSPKLPTLWLNTANGKRYTIGDASTHYLSFVPDGGDAISQTTYAAGIVTHDGFRFCRPYQGLDSTFKVQKFVQQTDGTLLCTDDGKSTITAPYLDSLLVTKTLVWQIEPSTLGGDFVKAYDDVVTGCKTSFKTVFQYMQLRYDGASKNYELLFKNGKYTGKLYIGVTTSGTDKVSYTFADDGDNNGKVHLTRVAAFKTFMTLLTSSGYTLSATSTIAPTRVKFTSDANSSNYFYVDVQ
jgi:hypothetical protein